MVLPCRGSYDLIGRVYASGSMGVPLALHVLSGDAGERVVYGDSRGAAVLLLCGSRELPARDLISTDTHKVNKLCGCMCVPGGEGMVHLPCLFCPLWCWCLGRSRQAVYHPKRVLSMAVCSGAARA